MHVAALGSFLRSSAVHKARQQPKPRPPGEPLSSMSSTRRAPESLNVPFLASTKVRELVDSYIEPNYSSRVVTDVWKVDRIDVLGDQDG